MNTMPIVRLWNHISKRRKYQFVLLLILMLVTSLFEIVSIGAVVPFLGALTAPEHVFNHQAAQPFISILELTSPEQLLFPLTVAFCVAAIFAGVTRLILMWASTRLSFAAGADLSIDIYHRTLYQPYSVHVSRNSSEVISGITKKTDSVIYQIMTPILWLISACIMMTAILITMLAVDPVIALTALLGFGSIYGSIVLVTRRKLSRNSDRTARETTQVVKALQEGLGGIRDVLIDGTQAIYCKIYRNADLPMREALASTLFISSSPKFAMETLGMIFIAVLAYVLMQQPEGVTRAIPVLGALALGAQRLLPVLQQGYSSWSKIRGSEAQLLDTLDLLDQPLPGYASQSQVAPLNFEKQISLQKVSFRYTSDSPKVLRDVDIKIAKGARVGFIGATGSGKSTLLDILMGLLPPTGGVMKIDDVSITIDNQRSWQAHIAHVPQNIYLSDTTIEENIAFGLAKDQIDHERVRLAAKQAQIADDIEQWPQQYKTFVGERGIRLSGGERQRIAIARALYKKADVIIFDEATSALDNDTERAVMQAIDELGSELTILIIAHRLTTLKNCDQLIKLGSDGVLRNCQYQDITVRQH